MSSSQLAIAQVCDEIKDLLLQKNSKYGDSALDPCRVFSKSSPVEQILVRIDDKLSRIQRGAGLLDTDEDVINDLIGYLVLLKIAMKKDKPAKINLKNLQIEESFNGYLGENPWDGEDIEALYGDAYHTLRVSTKL